MQEADVIVIGAGAAGFMAAIEAAKRGRKVLLLDKATKIGEKIRISGGGRCNFTNINAGPENYLSQNPHFCKSALNQYSAQDFISLVEEHGIAYHEKKLGQLFCDEGSQQIINMLFKEAAKHGVEIKKSFEITKVQKIADAFEISGSEKLQANSLIVATGGLSIPQIGATDFAHRLAKQFELNVIEPCPALVPFTCKGSLLETCKSLSGISIDANLSLNGTSFRENILFTHLGLSGPAILQISSYWQQGESIVINLLPELNLFERLLELKQTKDAKKHLKNILKEYLPDRFVDEWAKLYKLDGILAEYSNQGLEKITASLQQWQLKPSGTEGYKKAEVTVGGVDTNELSSKTMEAKKVPGLYIIGEAVDVTGWLGGYNFQWAWASGYVAGQNC